MANGVNFPYGDPTEAVVAATGTTALTIADQLTVITTPLLTGNATLNLTIGAQVKDGAMLFIVCSTTATETFTFGTGIEAPVVTGVAGKTWSQGFVYNGTAFFPMGAKIQVD